MAITVTHSKVVTSPDDPSYPVGANEWNDNHVVAGVTPTDVTAYGATGDGITDDRAAIQACIDAVSAQGGGGVLFPQTTAYYLIDSYVALSNGLYNLHIPSNIELIGVGDPLLKQGPNGAPVGGPTLFLNIQNLLGWPAYAYQNPAYNGGYYNLTAITANDVTVTLSSVGDAAASGSISSKTLLLAKPPALPL